MWIPSRLFAELGFEKLFAQAINTVETGEFYMFTTHIW